MLQLMSCVLCLLWVAMLRPMWPVLELMQQLICCHWQQCQLLLVPHYPTRCCRHRHHHYQYQYQQQQQQRWRAMHLAWPSSRWCWTGLAVQPSWPYQQQQQRCLLRLVVGQGI
jgi:hypothetical protein